MRKLALLTSFLVVFYSLEYAVLFPAHHQSLMAKAKRTMALMVVLSFVLVASIIVLFEQRVQENASSQVFDALVESADNVEGVVDTELKGYMDAIRFLHNSPSVYGLVNVANGSSPVSAYPLSSEQWKQQVEQAFIAFMESNDEINQLRIILADEKGSEFVRVERNERNIDVVPANGLQNKGNRDYFLASINRNRNEFYVSGINLNREYGEIEFPYRSTLRLSLPLFDHEGGRYGFVIANINAEHLLGEMRNALFGDQQLIVSDNEGFFIVHPDDEKAFSKDLNQAITWSSEYQSPVVQGQGIVYPKQSDAQTFYAVSRAFYLANRASSKPLYFHAITYESYVETIVYEKRIGAYSVIAVVALVFAIVLWFMYRSNLDNLTLANVRRESAAVVASSKDAIFSVDDEGKITSWNMAAETLFDTPSQLVVGHHFEGCTALTSLGIDFVFTGPETQTTYSAQYVDNNKKEHYLAVTASKILDTEDGLSSVAFVIRDITEERYAKVAIEKINAELEEKVQRRTKDLLKATREAKKASEVKSAFISNISHEMRTPLNGIIGSLALLKKQALNEKSTQLLSMVDTSCNSLNTLINDVLDLSKIEAGKLDINYQYFDALMLIESIAKVFAVKAQNKGLQLLVDYTKLDSEKVYSDPHRINQILSNLLNNAIKFTEKGHVLLRVETHTGSGTLRQLHFSIIDTGIGIAPEHQTKLFNPFTQADSKVAVQYGGTGLGLSICRQLSTLLGGDIELNSTQDKGSEFSFYITYQSVDMECVQAPGEIGGHIAMLADMCWGISSPYAPLEDNLRTLLLHEGAAVHVVEKEPEGNLEYWLQFDALMVDESSTLIHFFDAIWQAANTDKRIADMPTIYVLQSVGATAVSYQHVSVEYLSKPLLKSSLQTLAKQNLHRHFRSDNEEIAASAIKVKPLPTKNKNVEHAQDAIENANVLIVDDNLINREVAKGVLEGLPINVFTCSNGEEVIAFLKKCEEKALQVHTVLMDCQMPIMDGYKTTKAIRDGQTGKMHINVPIIAMTANAMRGEREKCMEAGMDDFSTKPVMAEVLIPKVKHWLVEQMKTSGYHTENVSPLVDNLMTNITDEVKRFSEESSQNRCWDKDSAIARIKGDKALFARVCSLFANSSPDKVKLLGKAMAHRDFEQVKMLTLKLKGMSADIGAVQLQHDFEQLWAFTKNGQWQKAADLLPTIEHDLTTFLKIMDVA